jgi:hypothetical protein
MNEGELMATDGVHKVNTVPGKWVEITWTPKNPGDYEIVTNATTPSAPCLAIMLQSPSASIAAAYDYEVHGNYEIFGPAARGITPSMPDPVGGPAAVAATAHMGSEFHEMQPTQRINHLKSATMAVLNSFSSPAQPERAVARQAVVPWNANRTHGNILAKGFQFLEHAIPAALSAFASL